MGLMKKLKRRGARDARVQQAKQEKREQRAAKVLTYTAKAREKEIGEIEQQTWNDMQIVLYTALRESFGFGGKRLTKLFSHVQRLAECVRDDFITHVSEDALAGVLEQETGFSARLDRMNPHDDKSVKRRAMQRISLYFFFTLHDKFDFGKQRLEATRHACARLGKELADGTRTMDGMLDDLSKVRHFIFEWRDE